MSITIMIENNEKYIDNNAPELIETETYDCQCVDFSEDGKPVSTCYECKGKGIISFTHYPFELNVANANFSTLWNSLGLEHDYCGEIDPRVVLKAINRTPVALIERQITEDNEEGKVHIINCGIHTKQAQRYITALTEICEEAEKREEKVYWG